MSNIRPAHVVLASAYAITIGWAGAVWHMHAPGDAPSIKTALGASLITAGMIGLTAIRSKETAKTAVSVFLYLWPIFVISAMTIGCYAGWVHAEGVSMILGFLAWFISFFVISSGQTSGTVTTNGWTRYDND